MKVDFISLVEKSFNDKNTGKDIVYYKINIADTNGDLHELPVHRDMDKEKVHSIPKYTSATISFGFQDNQIRVLDVN
jgi:hypothetical protein